MIRSRPEFGTAAMFEDLIAEDQGFMDEPLIVDSPQPKAVTFANHIRNRANALINLLPVTHIYQNVLRSIAYLDWQEEQVASDYLIYLGFAKIGDDQSAIAYLDWLEPRMRRWLSRYEQMLNCHKLEIKELIEAIERN
jgi:hypothetical protein